MIVYFSTVQVNGYPVYWKIKENLNSKKLQAHCDYMRSNLPKSLINLHVIGKKGITLDSHQNACIEDYEAFIKKHPPTESVFYRDEASSSDNVSINSEDSQSIPDPDSQEECVFTALFLNSQGSNLAYYGMRKNNISYIKNLLKYNVLSQTEWYGLINGLRSLVYHHLNIQNLEYIKAICNLFDKETIASAEVKFYLRKAIQITFKNADALVKSLQLSNIEGLSQQSIENPLDKDKNPFADCENPFVHCEDPFVLFELNVQLKTRFNVEEAQVESMLCFLNLFSQEYDLPGKNILRNDLEASGHNKKDAYLLLLNKLKTHLLYHHAIAEIVANIEITTDNEFLQLNKFIEQLSKQLQQPNDKNHPLLSYFYKTLFTHPDDFIFNQELEWIQIDKDCHSYITLRNLINKYAADNEILLNKYSISRSDFVKILLTRIENEFLKSMKSLKRTPIVNSSDLKLHVSNGAASKIISNLQECKNSLLKAKHKKTPKFFGTSSKKDSPIDMIFNIFWNEINPAENNKDNNHLESPSSAAASSSASSSTMSKSDTPIAS